MTTTDSIFRDDEPKFKIYRYLQGSCGNCGEPTDFTIRCFVGMVETGEASWTDFYEVASERIVSRMISMMKNPPQKKEIT